MQKFKDNISTFNIAHYILLFLVACICITAIAYTAITHNNHTPENNITINPPKTPATACINRVTRQIHQMWQYNPKSVPQQYWEIAMTYLNTPIAETTYGLCQDVAYVCHAGQIRRNCDPCAVPSARKYAQSIHISDAITENCTR